jgi:hypothetical protein
MLRLSIHQRKPITMIHKIQYWKRGHWVRSATIVSEENNGYDLWHAMKAAGWSCFVYQLGTISGIAPAPCDYCVQDYQDWLAQADDPPVFSHGDEDEDEDEDPCTLDVDDDGLPKRRYEDEDESSSPQKNPEQETGVPAKDSMERFYSQIITRIENDVSGMYKSVPRSAQEAFQEAEPAYKAWLSGKPVEFWCPVTERWHLWESLESLGRQDFPEFAHPERIWRSVHWYESETVPAKPEPAPSMVADDDSFFLKGLDRLLQWHLRYDQALASTKTTQIHDSIHLDHDDHEAAEADFWLYAVGLLENAHQPRITAKGQALLHRLWSQVERFLDEPAVIKAIETSIQGWEGPDYLSKFRRVYLKAGDVFPVDKPSFFVSEDGALVKTLFREGQTLRDSTPPNLYFWLELITA